MASTRRSPISRRTPREVFVYSYRILYEVLPGEVQILAFLHGARDFDRWLRERYAEQSQIKSPEPAPEEGAE